MIVDRFARRRLNKEQIDTALKVIRALLQSQELVDFAYLHGSALDFRRGNQSILPHDIDVAIYLGGGDWATVELELQSQFHKHTGLSPEVLDVHTLNNAPLQVIIGILKSGSLLFCRDNLKHADFLEHVSNSVRRLAGFFEAAYA
jgi:predicted nucleotidyltransferase